ADPLLRESIRPEVVARLRNNFERRTPSTPDQKAALRDGFMKLVEADVDIILATDATGPLLSRDALKPFWDRAALSCGNTPTSRRFSNSIGAPMKKMLKTVIVLLAAAPALPVPGAHAQGTQYVRFLVPGSGDTAYGIVDGQNIRELQGRLFDM